MAWGNCEITLDVEDENEELLGGKGNIAPVVEDAKGAAKVEKKMVSCVLFVLC